MKHHIDNKPAFEGLNADSIPHACLTKSSLPCAELPNHSTPDLFALIQPGLIAPTHVQRKFFINLLTESWGRMTPVEVVQDLDRYLASIPEEVMTAPDPSIEEWNVSRARFNYCASLMRALQNHNRNIIHLSPQESAKNNLASPLIEAGFFQILQNQALFTLDTSREILSALTSNNERLRTWSWEESRLIIDLSRQKEFPGIHSPDFYEVLFLTRMGTRINNFSCQRGLGSQGRMLSAAAKEMLSETLGRAPNLNANGSESLSREPSLGGLANTLGDLMNAGRSALQGTQESTLLLECSIELRNLPASWRRG